MQLSPHFSLDELTLSQTAVRLGIDNRPPPAVVENLRLLAAKLEQVRALTGKPLTVSSGYRSPVLNFEVGGAKNSAHVGGQAADITCPGMTPRELAHLIRDSGIEFDQCILEGDRWVHLGIAVGLQRREVLTATFNGGHATYTKGIA